jgi:hypothetical protein
MKERISAIHSAEVERFFERLGLRQQLLDGVLRCAVCRAAISPVTFKSAWRHHGSLLFFCERPACEPDELPDSANTVGVNASESQAG